MDITTERAAGDVAVMHLAGELDASNFERVIAATRQLAKRQLTWLRAMPKRQVVPCDAADATERVVALAEALAPR